MKKTFHRGDILKIVLNSSEQSGHKECYRNCLVLSPQKFNRLGFTLVAPITSNENMSRFEGFAVPLCVDSNITEGVAMISGVKSLSLDENNAVKIEEAPKLVMDEALAIFSAILDD